MRTIKAKDSAQLKGSTRGAGGGLITKIKAGNLLIGGGNSKAEGSLGSPKVPSEASHKSWRLVKEPQSSWAEATKSRGAKANGIKKKNDLGQNGLKKTKGRKRLNMSRGKWLQPRTALGAHIYERLGKDQSRKGSS